MDTVYDIVVNMMDGSPDYDKRMTLKLAAVDVREIKRGAKMSGEQLPKDLAVRKYWETWNEILMGK